MIARSDGTSPFHFHVHCLWVLLTRLPELSVPQEPEPDVAPTQNTLLSPPIVRRRTPNVMATSICIVYLKRNGCKVEMQMLYYKDSGYKRA